MFHKSLRKDWNCSSIHRSWKNLPKLRCFHHFCSVNLQKCFGINNCRGFSKVFIDYFPITVSLIRWSEFNFCYPDQNRLIPWVIPRSTLFPFISFKHRLPQLSQKAQCSSYFFYLHPYKDEVSQLQIWSSFLQFIPHWIGSALKCHYLISPKND